MAGNIVTLKRCRLAPDMVEDLHLLHENAWAMADDVQEKAAEASKASETSLDASKQH